jgi:hypothetical protein
MKSKLNKLCAALAAVLVAAPALPQTMPDIGFESVGRGRALAASVIDRENVGPDRIFPPGPPGGGLPRGEWTLYGFPNDAPPEGVEALPRDLFNSPDFYADKDLWTDPRYFRCNSPYATEIQQGILFPPALADDPADGPWGFCDKDLPREAIVSPYEFATAQEHYEALLAETTARGGPNKYTFADFPAVEWNGVYARPTAGQDQLTWYWLRHSQYPTMLSLLTPEYQQRMVQEAYHQVRGHALWPSTFCWPEGFMRRFYSFSIWEQYLTATPDMVQFIGGVADNFITSVYVGREFKMDDVAAGGVPRLGEAVPRWYGETVGFWDGDTLITWTSNIQGWKAHSAFEFSSKLQTIEIYTPNRDAEGKFLGLNHETILYDEEAFTQPLRIIRNLNKINDYTDAEETPYAFIECTQTIYNIEGVNTPLAPGSIVEFELPDMYGRPWDAIWQKYFEQGMTRPSEVSDDLFNFE